MALLRRLAHSSAARDAVWWGYSGACGTNSGVMGSTGPSGLPLLQQLLAPQAVRSHGGGSCCGGGHEHGHHHDHGHDHAPDHLEDLPKDELADAETRTAWVPPSMGIAAQQAVAAAAAEAESSSTASSGPSDVSHLPKHMQEVYTTLRSMGLEPGVECVVGDGLAVVDIGVFAQGHQISVEVEEGEGAVAGMRPQASARMYTLQRVREKVLETHGWLVVRLQQGRWASLSNPHDRMHYLLDELKGAVGAAHKANGGGCCGGGCH